MNTIQDLLHTLENNFEQYYRLLQTLSEQPGIAKVHQRQLGKFLSNLKTVQDEVVDFRLGKILAEEHPYIPRIVIHDGEASGQNGLQQLARAFLRRRAELLDTLKNLPAPNWERTGVHEIEGHISFKEFVRRMIEKDQNALGRLSDEFCLPPG